MLHWMLDTNLCVRVLRDRPPGLRPRFSSEAAKLCISSICFAELVYGAEKSAKPAETLPEVERFAARLAVLAFDDRAAAHAANIRATLERRDAPIGAYDLLIAGHARSLGLVVVTGNLKDFGRVEGLRAENWFG
ncbi:MAG: tRNA(fMet)-specific endonuclease VapC [Caulobacteraceae bacterium]|nr:tRNA(fMet)-specific endonuclease VapC [Caulobacteraceae bacterium]